MRQTKHHTPLALLSILIIVIALIGSPRIAQGVYDLANKIHPSLIAASEQKSDGIFPVIVQKTSKQANVESLALHLGGKNLLDLSMINAFGIELTGAALRELAAHPGVRWISPDGPVEKSSASVSVGETTNTYLQTIKQNLLPSTLNGSGIGVAVIDSGVSPTRDLANRIPKYVDINIDGPACAYGHGTHVAGIIGGNGAMSQGQYRGVAPAVKIIDIKVSDCYGGGRVSHVVAGMQWVLNNKATYNIRVVNISLNQTVAESYHTSPLAAAAEILWFNKIVVVVSAGNIADGNLYPPANDPFVITVGALNEWGTAAPNDDFVALFSGFGKTSDGVSKPDLVAPGVNIISTRKGDSYLSLNYPAHIVNANYFRMSGTSMAAAVVSGAVALLLQDEPNLTPDQVKYRLKSTARVMPSQARAGAGVLNIQAAVNATSTASANTGTRVSNQLNTGSQGIGSNVSWNSVSWNSVSWNSVSWNSVSWNSVSWNSTFWGD